MATTSIPVSYTHLDVYKRQAHPDALVINVAGEASWLMNMQEMGTAMQFRAPVKQFILNNERLGMVRQWQQLLHGERYSQSWSEACLLYTSRCV